MFRKLLLIGLIAGISVGGYCYFKKPTIVIPRDPPPVEVKVLTENEKILRYSVACLSVLPGYAPLPWEPLRVIGAMNGDTLEKIAQRDPLAFLELCLNRYERNVDGNRVIFLKQERVKGKLQPPEKVRVSFREKPVSVFMDWIEGARLARKSLYVEGENNGKVLVRPNVPFLPVISVDVNGSQAQETSRYGIDKFGMGFAIRACVESMRAAKKAGTLHLSFEGVVSLDRVGERPCFKFVRKPYAPPEEDGVNEITLYIDEDTLLQVGSILRDEKGELIAEYFFRDIELNPVFDADQFTRQSLR